MQSICYDISENFQHLVQLLNFVYLRIICLTLLYYNKEKQNQLCKVNWVCFPTKEHNSYPHKIDCTEGKWYHITLVYYKSYSNA